MNTSRHLYAIAGLVGILTIGSLASSRGNTRVSGGAPVVVTNTTSNPIPTSAQGITQVSGNISVSNTAANAVFVRDGSGHTTFFGQASTQFFDGSDTAESDSEFTVPAGKQFIVQQVIATAQIGYGEKVTLVNVSYHLAVPLLDQGDMLVNGLNSEHIEYYEANFPTQYIIGEGPVGIVSKRNSFSGSGRVDVLMFGYLQDAPSQ